MNDFQQAMIDRIFTMKNAWGGFSRNDGRWRNIFLMPSGERPIVAFQSKRERNQHKQEAIHIDDVDRDTFTDMTPEALVKVFEAIVRRSSLQM